MQSATNRNAQDESVITSTRPRILFAEAKMIISFHLDVEKAGKAALVAQASGRVHLIDINNSDGRDPGQTLQQFSLRDAERVGGGGRQNHSFGAIFAAHDSMVVFGSIGGRVLIWDREKGRVKHELDHEGGMW